MTRYFAKNADGEYGFYSDTIHGDNIPPGGAVVDDDTLEYLMAAQGVTGEIGPDASGNPVIIPWTPAQLTAQQIVVAKAQLAELDKTLPRAIEDMWEAINFDTTTLPQVQKDRLATKQSLRAKIATLTSETAPP